ncbi:MAG: adenosylcobinamide-GDP ribazoletransferase [Desulfobacterales bacterium]|nr:adenosylcobinamide-GDP ribazoletransferase [Desulfobacterales bacterium]
MNGLIAAIQFLTVFRLSKQAAFEPEKMLPFFPVVGILIGVFLGCFDRTIALVWENHIVSLLDVLFLAWITGGLHIDGLGDTADGLYGNRPKEKALAIMKDSRIGAMGMIAIFFGLTVKWAAIDGMESGRFIALLVVPAFARSSILFGTRFLAYGRTEGLGKDFFSSAIQWRSFLWVLLPIGLSLFLGGKALLVICGFFFLTGAMVLFYKKRINCITGDMLGAMNEICEAGLFLVVAMGCAP